MIFDIYSLYSFGCFILPGSVWLFLNREKIARKRYRCRHVIYFKCHYVHAAWIFAAIDLAQVPENGKNSAYRFLYVAFH